MTATIPYITILMTVYNGGEYLAKAIRSVLAQDFRDYEFLIIDDCSTDDSVKTVESFTDPRIRLVRNPQNIGQTASLNIGLRESQGEYIARIDADDVALPGWLSAQAEFAKRHPDAAVITLPVVLISTSGQVRKLQGTFSAPQDIYLRILTHSPINHGGCFMRREVVLKEGGYDNELKIAADYGLWSNLIRKGHSFKASGFAGMAVRVHGGAITKTSKERLRQEMKRVFGENIVAFTNYQPSAEDLEDLWGLFHDLDNFPRERVQGAEAVFEKILLSRKASLGVLDGACRHYLKAILKENVWRVKFRKYCDLWGWKIIHAAARNWLRWKAIVSVRKFIID